MKGRKPQPTTLKLIRGEKNKKRINKAEPKPRPGRPSCPSHLSVQARKEWKWIAPELDRLGLLTKIDRATLAAYCQAYGRWVEAEQLMKGKPPVIKTAKGNWIKNPLLWVIDKAYDQMYKYLTEFGLSPSSRGRITLTPPADDEDDLLT